MESDIIRSVVKQILALNIRLVLFFLSWVLANAIISSTLLLSINRWIRKVESDIIRSVVIQILALNIGLFCLC